MKPQISDYIGRKVVQVRKSEKQDWAWAIELEGQVLISNKDRDEIFAPDHLNDCKLESVSLSVRDTTIHFRAPNGTVHHIGMSPTQYTILDPTYGGEAFPQWPEELEEKGISSHPEEPVSAEPSPQWPAEEERLQKEAQTRREREAAEFLQDTEDSE